MSTATLAASSVMSQAFAAIRRTSVHSYCRSKTTAAAAAGAGAIDGFKAQAQRYMEAGGRKLRLALPEVSEDKRVTEAAERLERTGHFEVVRSLVELDEANQVLRAGEIDGCVAGAVHATGKVIKSALKNVGLTDGCKTVSSFFLMDMPHLFDEACLFSDCGVMIQPNASQLADIACETERSFRFLFPTRTPVMGLLSFSTKGSAKGPDVEKVQACLEEVRRRRGDELLVDGELQLDACVVPEILAKKTNNSSPLLGHLPVNCFIFPDLDAGNIGYKLAQRFGGARATGPILQGLKAPSNDLSRGCSVQDIEDAAYVTAMQTGLLKTE